MRSDPGFDTNFFASELLRCYGVQVACIRFVPRGEDSFSYDVQAADGKKYFLKIYRRGLIEASLELSYKLEAIHQLTFSLPPLLTQNEELSIMLAGLRGALFPFLDSVCSSSSITLVDLERLGEQFGRLHGLPPDAVSRLAAEDFMVTARRTSDLDALRRLDGARRSPALDV